MKPRRDYGSKTDWENGTIDWFSYTKGYGFVTPEPGAALGSAGVFLPPDMLALSAMPVSDVRYRGVRVQFRRFYLDATRASAIRRACAAGSVVAQLDARACELARSTNPDDMADAALMREAADKLRAVDRPEPQPSALEDFMFNALSNL